MLFNRSSRVQAAVASTGHFIPTAQSLDLCLAACAWQKATCRQVKISGGWYQLRKRQFGQVQVGVIWRLAAQLGVLDLDSVLHAAEFASVKVVNNYHVAPRQDRCKELLDIGQERRSTDRTVHDPTDLQACCCANREGT